MMLEKILLRVDMLKLLISGKIDIFKLWMKKEYLQFKMDWKEDPSIIIAVFFIVMGLLEDQLPTFIVLGMIFYCMIFFTRRIDKKEERKVIESLDIDRLGTENDKTITVILDQFISDCFVRDVLFTSGLKDGDYINESEEQKMLKSLLDSVASNMSYYIRKKLDHYYGEGRTDIIIARKCFVTVSMHVANNNKSLYMK